MNEFLVLVWEGNLERKTAQDEVSVQTYLISQGILCKELYRFTHVKNYTTILVSFPVTNIINKSFNPIYLGQATPNKHKINKS